MIGRRTDGSPIRRPLSPHLQVYDMMQLTSALSISSRITGCAWAIGLRVAGVVAGGRRLRAFGLRQCAVVPRPPGSALLILFGMSGGGLVPHLERHPAPRLGCGLWLRHPDHLPLRPPGADRHRGADGADLARRHRGLGVRGERAMASTNTRNTPRSARRSAACAGSARRSRGTHHWWHQRVTSVALLPLTLWFVLSAALLAGASHAETVAWIGAALQRGAAAGDDRPHLPPHRRRRAGHPRGLCEPGMGRMGSILAVKALCALLALASALAVLRIAV